MLLVEHVGVTFGGCLACRRLVAQMCLLAWVVLIQLIYGRRRTPLLGAPGLHALVESLVALLPFGWAAAHVEGEAQRVAVAVGCIASDEFVWHPHGLGFTYDFAFSIVFAFAVSFLAFPFAFVGVFPFSFGSLVL